MLRVSLSLLLFSTLAAAQENGRELSARVLLVNRGTVQIDRGSDDGVVPGDRVRFHPIGAAETYALIDRVEGRTAWIEWKDIPSGIEPGTPCEVLISIAPVETPMLPGYVLGDGLPNTAPQWSKREGLWDPSRPLLAEDPLQPEERDSIWSGRYYSNFQGVRETDQADSTSLYGRSGLDLRGSNPFGMGGALRFSVDLDYSSYAASGRATDSSFAARLERLSYVHGGDRFQPTKWEVGRFLHSEFPEFGVIDGIEASYRFEQGDKFGGSFGYLPEPSRQFTTGKDLQVTSYYRGVLGEDQNVRWGAGLQKTWHEGQADRDLAIFKFDYRADRDFDFRSSAWVDFYDATDVGKPKGAEVTSLTARATWRIEDDGLALGVNQWRYPSQLRYQAGSFTNFELLNSKTTRLDLRAWHKLAGGSRLTGRVDSWKSEDDSGGGAEFNWNLPNWLAENSTTTFSVFDRQGTYTDYLGLRFDQSLNLDSGNWRLSMETAQYQPIDRGDSTLNQNDIRLSWSHWSRDGWSLNVDGGYRFGDQQNSPSVGFYLQRSF
jgi:hypothetical protein